MAAADRKASALTKACAGAVSVFLLHGREGEEFLATVLQIERGAEPRHRRPARAAGARRTAPRTGWWRARDHRVRLESADPATHRFVVAPVRVRVRPRVGGGRVTGCSHG